MRTVLSSFAVVSVVALSGCLQTQRAHTFHFATTEVPVEQVSRALATMGHPPADTNQSSGIVTTQWVDTGFLYGQVQGQSATLVRRYLVVVTPQGEVTTRAELQQCPRGGFTIGGVAIRGTCQGVDGIPESMQRELDQIAEDLRRAVGGSDVANIPPPPANG